MPDTNPIQSAPMIAYMLQNPAGAMQLQQQQGLAQQMMQEGGQQPAANEMVSGHVVPMSLGGAIARAGERILGAYEQGQVNKKLGEAMMAPQAPNGQQGNGQGQVLGQTLMQSIQSGSVTGNPQADWQYYLSSPGDYFGAMAKAHLPTDLQKNVGNPASAPYMNKDLITTGAGNVPIPTSAVLEHYGQGQPQQPPVQSSPAPRGNPSTTPQSPAGQAALGDMYGTQPSIPGVNPTPMSPQGNGGEVVLSGEGQPAPSGNSAIRVPYNPFNPNENAANTKLAEEGATNIGASEKSQAAIESRLNNATAILDKQIALAPKTFEGSMGEKAQGIVENWKNIPLPNSWKPTSYGDPASQAQFEQNNANLTTQSLPAILPPGSRMDIPFVQLITKAETIPPYAPADAKIAVAQNQKQALKFLAENVFNNTDLLKEMTAPAGTPLSPRMQQINAQYQQIMNGGQAQGQTQSSSMPDTKTINGVTYTKINGVWHQ